MKHALSICWLAVGLVLCWALGETAYTMHVARAKVLATLTDADRATVIIAGAATDIEKGARQWKDASAEQTKQTTLAMSRVSAAAEGLSSLVSHTDSSLNSVLLPTLTDSIKSQNAALLSTEDSLQQNLLQTRSAGEQLQATLATADKVLGDPRIPESLQNIADGTKHLSASTADVQQVADKFRDDFVKPKNRAWAYVKALLGLGSQGRILFGGAR